jgi:aminoglycoside phosphotransferase (APT) family kinase protein
MARDLDSLVSALRAWLPDGESIESVVPLSLGHSNETYLLTGIDRILRTPPSEVGLLPPYDMPGQHGLLKRLGNADGAPPVPGVHELCADASVVGDPFFIMDRVSGTAFEDEIPDWVRSGEVEVRSEVCRQWLDAIFGVQLLPTTVVGKPGRTPAESVEHWLGVAEESAAPKELVELLSALVDDPAPISGPATPLHGDPKVANCMWHDGRLSALLDWELAGVGEPLLDLGHLLPYFPPAELVETAGEPHTLPGWWSREQVIAHWEDRLGRSADGLAWYEAAGLSKMAAIMSVGVNLSRTGQSTDPRFAAWEPAVMAASTHGLARLRAAD